VIKRKQSWAFEPSTLARHVGLAPAASDSGLLNGPDLLFDEVDHVAFQSNAVKRVDLLNAGGAGHVNFGQKIANHIQADEIQTVGNQQASKSVTDFPISRA
jgi:hypothetical protein